MSEHERGAIRNEDAYRRAKMLDHSGWQRGDKLVRLITPSDIDMCFDSKGCALLCEISSSVDRWRDLRRGQRLLYESLVRGGPHCAILCRLDESAMAEPHIDTTRDVRCFELMLFDQEFLFVGPKSGKVLRKFVSNWLIDPLRQRRALFAIARRPRA